MERKINMEVSLSKNFNKVTLGLVEETITFEDELDFESKVGKLFNTLRGQVLLELEKIRK